MARTRLANRLHRGLDNGPARDFANFTPLLHRQALRQVAVDRVVRARVVGHAAGRDAALHEFGKCVRGVAQPPNKADLPVRFARLDDGKRLTDRLRLAVYAARFQAESTHVSWYCTAIIEKPAMVVASGCAH